MWRIIIESRAFIKAATLLVIKINDFQHVVGDHSELRAHGDNLQKEVNQLFSGLQNPTLPSAYRLRDTAYRNGFQVDPRVLNRLSQFEYLTT